MLTTHLIRGGGAVEEARDSRACPPAPANDDESEDVLTHSQGLNKCVWESLSDSPPPTDRITLSGNEVEGGGGS